MDLQSLIAKMDQIEAKGKITEAITLDAIIAAVGQDKDEQSRAAKLNDIAWKEKLPGLYDPVSGNFVSKQSMPSGMVQRYNIAATGSEKSDRALADLGLIPDNANTSTALGRMFRGDDKKQYDQDIKTRSLSASGNKPDGEAGQATAANPGTAAAGSAFNQGAAVDQAAVPASANASSGYAGATPPAVNKDLEKIKQLLAKAQAGKTVAKESVSMISLKMSQLVESFGYVYEGLEDLSDAERKELAALLDKNKDNPEAKDYIAQYEKLRPGPNTSSYTGAGGTSNVTNDPAGPNTSSYTAPGGTDNVTNDPVANKPADPAKKKSRYPVNPGTRAYQNWLNSNGLKVAIDGAFGPESQGAGEKIQKLKPAEFSVTSGSRAQEMKDMMAIGAAYNVRPDKNDTGNYTWIGSKKYLADMQKYGYDPKTGNPIGGAKPPGEAGMPTKDASAPAAGIPPELSKAVPSPKSGEEYWIKGIRYEFKKEWDGTQWKNNWKVTYNPGEFTMNGATRRAANSGYTGPGDIVSMNAGMATLDREKNLAASKTPTTESAEFDRLKELLKF
jgi:hypothetical protein